MSESPYKRIDRAVYKAERALVVASLLVMSVVVFLDVVHRSFSGNESKFAIAVAKLSGWVGIDIAEGTSAYQQLVDASPFVMFVVFTGLAYFGIRSAKRATPVAWLMALLGAVGGVLVAYGLVRLLLVVMPNGLTWSQPFALVLTLWVGFIGASMCTYENRHLKVEAVQRHLPDKWRPGVGFVSGAFTMVVCLVLLWLSVRYFLPVYHESSTEGGGLFPGTAIPRYLAVGALPIAFTFMSIRFGARALAALRGELVEPADPVAAAGGALAPDDHGRMPSEVATEAIPGGIEDDGKESAVDTMTSESRMKREINIPQPQSKVPTDAHEVLPSVASSLGWDLDEGDSDEVDGNLVRTREVEEGPIQFIERTGEIHTSPTDDDAEPGEGS